MTPEQKQRLIAQANAAQRLGLENQRLQRRIRELEAEIAKPQRHAARLDAEMRERSEHHRGNAWIERDGAMAYHRPGRVDEDGGPDEWAFPPGWPEGVDPEHYIAAKLGLMVREVTPTHPTSDGSPASTWMGSLVPDK